MGWRIRLAKKNAKKAYQTTKKIVHTGKQVLNAMPTVNTEKLNQDFTFNPNTDTFFILDNQPKVSSPTRKKRKLKPRKVVYY